MLSVVFHMVKVKDALAHKYRDLLDSALIFIGTSVCNKNEKKSFCSRAQGSVLGTRLST